MLRPLGPTVLNQIRPTCLKQEVPQTEGIWQRLVLSLCNFMDRLALHPVGAIAISYVHSVLLKSDVSKIHKSLLIWFYRNEVRET